MLHVSPFLSIVREVTFRHPKYLNVIIKLHKSQLTLLNLVAINIVSIKLSKYNS